MAGAREEHCARFRSVSFARTVSLRTCGPLAIGGRTRARADSSGTATDAPVDVYELRLVLQRHLWNRNDSSFKVRRPRDRLDGAVGFAFGARTLFGDPGGSQEQSD